MPYFTLKLLVNLGLIFTFVLCDARGQDEGNTPASRLMRKSVRVEFLPPSTVALEIARHFGIRIGIEDFQPTAERSSLLTRSTINFEMADATLEECFSALTKLVPKSDFRIQNGTAHFFVAEWMRDANNPLNARVAKVEFKGTRWDFYVFLNEQNNKIIGPAQFTLDEMEDWHRKGNVVTLSRRDATLREILDDFCARGGFRWTATTKENGRTELRIIKDLPPKQTQ